MVDGLKDLLVQLLGIRAVEGHLHQNKGICQTLHSNTNGSVAHVGGAGFLDRVVVDVDNLVEVAANNLLVGSVAVKYGEHQPWRSRATS